MSIARVQAKSAENALGTSPAVTLDTAATAGNLIVVGLGVDKSSGTITVPTGFTLVDKDEDATDASASIALAYKIAAGGETTITWTMGTARIANVIAAEYSGLSTSSVLDVYTKATSGATNTASQSTGTTATTTKSNELAIALFTVDSWAGEEGRSYSNGFSEVDWEAKSATGGDPGTYLAEKILSSTGTVESTLTRSGVNAADQMRGIIATFKAAEVVVETGSFVKATATGNQDITISTDLTAAAAGSWAIVFWLVGTTAASGTWDTRMRPSIGFVANGGGSISQYAYGSGDTDAADTTDSERHLGSKAIIVVSPGLLSEAEFVSFTSPTNMRINWTSMGSTAAARINYTIISGLRGAKAVNWTTPTTATTKAVTGVGFSPDLVFHSGSLLNTTSGSSIANLVFGTGAMNKHGQQWANGIVSEDNVGTTNNSRWQRTDSCIATPWVSEAANTRATFSSMDSDGFTTSFVSVNGTADHVISLCLDGINSKLGSFSKTSSVTSQTVTSSHNFVIKGSMFSNIGSATNTSPIAHLGWGLGASDGTNHVVAHVTGVDSATASNVDSVVFTNKSIMTHAAGGTTDTAGVISSPTTSQFDITWDSSTSSTAEFLYALFGDNSTDVAAGNTAGSGAAHNASESEGVSPANTSGTGSANNSSTSEGIQAGHTSASGTAHNLSSIESVTSGNAGATGAANNASISFDAFANAGNAGGTGSSFNATEAFLSGIQSAAATGSANNASVLVPGVNVEVGSFAKQSGTGNQDITISTDLTAAANGSWAIIMWLGGSDQSSGTWDNNVNQGMGFVANGGGTLKQFCVAASMANGSAGNTSRRLLEAVIGTSLVSDGSASNEGTFVSFPSSTSMRLNWAVNDGVASNINYMIFSGLTGAKIVSWTQSGTTQSVTGVGFSPDLVFHLLPQLTGSTANGSVHAAFSLGAMNKHGQQWSNGILGIDTGSTTNTSRCQQTDACIVSATTGDVLRDQASFVSMDSDGFTVYWANTNSTGTVFSLCLDGISSKLGSFKNATGTGSQTIKSNHRFTPKAFLSTNVGGSAIADPASHAIWGLSAVSGSNERFVGLYDQDDTATSDAKSIWRSDKGIAAVTFPSSSYMLGDVTLNTNDFAVDWTTQGGAQMQHLYCIVGDSEQNTFPARVIS